jgi:hypothetical protein
MSAAFDTNRPLAEIALWADGGARWVEQATEAARAAPRQRQVTITLDPAQPETFIAGFRKVARGLMGLAQPVPPPASPASKVCHLRLMR